MADQISNPDALSLDQGVHRDDDNSPILFHVKETSLIGNRLVNPTDADGNPSVVVLPEGTLPAENLIPLCDRGRALAEQYRRENEARVKRMMENNRPEGSVDAQALGAAIAAAVAEALASQKKENEDIAAAEALASQKKENEDIAAELAALKAERAAGAPAVTFA